MNGIENVVFFSHMRNGDLHFSRGFVRKIVDRVKQISPSVKFYYIHKNDSGLLADLTDVSYSNSHWGVLNDEYMKSCLVGNTLFLSTWYAAGKMEYLNRYGISFDCLYSVFDDHCKTWFGFQLSDISNDPFDFFPDIDYSKFHITDIQSCINGFGKCVLVCNGQALSGQAVNIDLVGPVVNLAKRYQDITFILTNCDDGKVTGISNILYSSDLINKQSGSDLNENSYISTFCPIVIGRASGAYSYSFTRGNLSDPNKTLISFSTSTLGGKVPISNWLGSRFCGCISYKANVSSYDVRTSSDAECIVNDFVKRIL